MPPCRHARAGGLLHARGSLPPQGWSPQGLEECPEDRAVRDDPRLDHDAGGTFLSRQFGHQSSDDAQGNPQNPANAGAACFVPDHEGDGRRGDCRNAHRKNEWSRERTPSPRHVAQAIRHPGEPGHVPQLRGPHRGRVRQLHQRGAAGAYFARRPPPHRGGRRQVRHNRRCLLRGRDPARGGRRGAVRHRGHGTKERGNRGGGQGQRSPYGALLHLHQP